MNRYYKNILKSTFLYEVIMKLKINAFRRKWVINNRHNQTIPMNIYDMSVVKVGNNSYGELNIITYSNESKLFIGNYVSIAQNVFFLLDVEHYTDHFSTYPFKVKLLNTVKDESFSKGHIVIEDDVWIGFGATILSGVHIGKGAVIAAGSLVVKDVEPYTVVGGCPAKILKRRFEENIVQKIKKFDFSILDEETVIRNLDNLYLKINENNINEILKNLNE